MRIRISLAGVFPLLLTIGVMAQTTVTTSGGTANSVPVFTGGSSVGNSVITQSGGNVGIGTANPGNSAWVAMTGGLDINGTGSTQFVIEKGGAPGLAINIAGGIPTFYDYYGSAWHSSITLQNGNVGIGTTSPQMPLDVGKYSTTSLFAGATLENTIGDGNYNSPMLLLGSGGWFNNGQFLRAAALQAVNDNWNVGQKALAFYTYDGHLGNNFTSATLADLYERMRISSSGNVGIGTTSPGAKLEVNGNIKLSSGSGASVTFADGTVQSTAWTGSLCGGDYAESVNVSGERKQYEAGDVLVIDPAHPGNFLKSTKPYSRLVAGIYSTKPGMIGRRQITTDPKLRAEEVPMAMVGIVPTKVTAENDPIEVGDLMVTSSQPGYAMKGRDGLMKTGTVIGKALGSLSSGTGVIEVLVSLQ